MIGKSSPPQLVKPVFDYLVAGAGFAGSVTAERLARRFGKTVLVVDKRPHLGGNAYDEADASGILVHRYGPHIFHTNSAEVFTYLSQFTEWRSYEHRVLASVDGKLVPIPINLDTVNLLYGLKLTSAEVEEFFAAHAKTCAESANLRGRGGLPRGTRPLREMFRGYTRKQWGLDPSMLDASVTARIPVRTNRDDRYFTDDYQAMPLHGYTRMFHNMLDHPNIRVECGRDYREVAKEVTFRELIYTGPVDEFFGCRYGKLPYRSLEFRHETHDKPVFQPAAVVNYPNEHAWTRITEFKYLTGQTASRTSIVYEYPRAEGDPYYPVPRAENQELYAKYRTLAEPCSGVHFAGRLATYKYYNMDQVVAQALALCARIAGTDRASVSEYTAEKPAQEQAA